MAVTDQLASDGLGESRATFDVDATTDLPASVGADAGQTARRRPRRQRISKWDRPPDPHDWRFYVGNLGKALITTGLLMFGFVAYQLWGTGIEYAAAQNSLESQFEQLANQNLADNPPPDNPSSDDPPGVADETADAPQIDTDPPTEADADVVADTESPIADAADTPIPVALDLSDQAVEKEPPTVRRGDVLARLDIPRINSNPMYVVPGVNLSDLKDGPGHYPDTPLPGQLGNAAIAGHRTTYGHPFFDVDQLVAGDEIVVTMVNGDRFVYLVTFTEIVGASEYWVVTTRDPNIAELTLTSCHPKYTARDRIVVHSVLDPTRSANVGVATFYDLEPADNEPIPGDDPVLVADSPTGDTAVAIDPSGNADVAPSIGGTPGVDDIVSSVPELTPPEPNAAGETQGNDQSAATPVANSEPAEVEDAFSQGWFDDRSAFPQIALWGLALTLISIGAYRISRRYRHDSFGLLVGIAPFLVALYFFFQNINRLLPPGL